MKNCLKQLNLLKGPPKDPKEPRSEATILSLVCSGCYAGVETRLSGCINQIEGASMASARLTTVGVLGLTGVPRNPSDNHCNVLRLGIPKEAHNCDKNNKFSYFKQCLRMFERKVEDIHQTNCRKNQFFEKNELTILKKMEK